MSDNAPVRTTGADAEELEPSLGELFTAAQKDMSLLVKQEIALLKSELAVSVRFGGLGVGLFAAAAFLAVLSTVMLSFFLVYLISLTGLDLVWSYLLVVVLYLALAGGLGFAGYRAVTRVKPPERTIAQAQETKETLLNRG